MNRRSALAAVGIALVLAAIATWSLLGTRETDVYAAALADFANSEAVYLSQPSTCEQDRSPDGIPDPLFQRFVEANRPEAGSIPLKSPRFRHLVADATQVEHSATAGVPISVLLQGNLPVYLSRVGFNDEESEALFCVTAQGNFFVHMKQTEGHWKLANIVITAVP